MTREQDTRTSDETPQMYYLAKDNLYAFDGMKARAVYEPSYYEQFPKDFTSSFTRWQGLKARLFGRKFDEPYITAYLYKGKFYITRLGRSI